MAAKWSQVEYHFDLELGRQDRSSEFVNNYHFQKKWEFFGGQRRICSVHVELLRKLNNTDVSSEAKFQPPWTANSQINCRLVYFFMCADIQINII